MLVIVAVLYNKCISNLERVYLSDFYFIKGGENPIKISVV